MKAVCFNCGKKIVIGEDKICSVSVLHTGLTGNRIWHGGTKLVQNAIFCEDCEVAANDAAVALCKCLAKMKDVNTLDNNTTDMI